MGRYIIIKHHPSPTPPYQLFIALNPYNILEYNKCVYIYYTYPYGFGLNPILPTCFIEKKTHIYRGYTYHKDNLSSWSSKPTPSSYGLVHSRPRGPPDFR